MQKAIATILILITTHFLPAAYGQEYPTRLITIVTPTGPGGPTDILARIVADKLSSTFGKSVIVENVPGASGLIGSSRVAKAEPTGYTLLMGNLGTHVLSMEVRRLEQNEQSLPYDPRRAFAPVALVAKDYLLIVTSKNVPTANLRVFTDYLRSKQGKATCGSTGIGSIPHVGCHLLAQLASVQVTHVPYRGVPPAMQDMIRGDIDFFCNLPGPARPLVEAGSIKALMFAGPTRSQLFPAVPTAAEEGLPTFQINVWNALFAPAGTPPQVIARINRGVQEVFRDPVTRKTLLDLGNVIPDPAEQTPDSLGAIVAEDFKRWTQSLHSLIRPK